MVLFWAQPLQTRRIRLLLGSGRLQRRANIGARITWVEEWEMKNELQFHCGIYCYKTLGIKSNRKFPHLT